MNGINGDMRGSQYKGNPKTSILVGFSIINHPFLDTPILGNLHMCTCRSVGWCLKRHAHKLCDSLFFIGEICRRKKHWWKLSKEFVFRILVHLYTIVIALYRPIPRVNCINRHEYTQVMRLRLFLEAIIFGVTPIFVFPLCACLWPSDVPRICTYHKKSL